MRLCGCLSVCLRCRWSAQAVGKLANLMTRAGRGSEALVLHETSVRANPDNAGVHIEYGMALGTSERTHRTQGERNERSEMMLCFSHHRSKKAEDFYREGQLKPFDNQRACLANTWQVSIV